MRLAIFAKTFVRPTLEATLDAVCEAGFGAAQFNLALAHDATPGAIAAAHRAHAVDMAACSGTVNLAHPDRATRAAGVAWLESVIRAAPAMGTRIVTLCTGTRDPDDMWRAHPGNVTAEAWADMRASVAAAVAAAETAGIVLGVEPEHGNVVRDAPAARRLLDELGSPTLRVVLDAANLGPAPGVLDEAFELLAVDIVLAHVKDARGPVDHERALTLLRETGFTGALVLHGMAEDEVAAELAAVRRHAAAARVELAA